MLRRQRQIHAQIQKLVDAMLFVAGFWLAHVLRSHWEIEIFGGTKVIKPFEDYAWLLLVIAPLAPVLLRFQGFYNRPLIASRRWTAWQLFKGCTLAVMGVIFVTFLLRVQLARAVVILFGPLSFVLVLAKEEAVRWWLQSKAGQEQLRKRLILAGTVADIVRLKADLQANPPGDLEIIAEMTLDGGPMDPLVELLHRHSANGVLMNAKHALFGQIEKVIQVCELEGVEVWLLADFFQTQISRTTFDELLGRPVLVFRSTPE